MTHTINDNGVQRQMTQKEVELYEQASAEIIADQENSNKEAQAKADAKAAVLAKLGLTAEEVNALFS